VQPLKVPTTWRDIVFESILFVQVTRGKKCLLTIIHQHCLASISTQTDSSPMPCSGVPIGFQEVEPTAWDIE
jgi:hypothetical protein